MSNYPKKLKKVFSIFFYLLLNFISGFSQQYNFHNYSVKDGVAQSQVYGLLQDSRGYLWMGTRGGGISRYDGINFKTFSINDGLINNYVFCIKEDQEHNIWIGTNNGLSKYNGISFTNFQPTNDSAQVWVQEIDIDSKGRKWLATNNGVIVLGNKGFINVTDKLKEKRTVINAIHVDRSGAIWYGNADGLFKITESDSKFFVIKFDKSQGFMNNSITSIKEDSEGNMWVGTYGDGVYVYDGKKFFRIDYHLELYKQTVLDIYFDTHKNVWFATLSHGVAEYNTLSKTFIWLTENEGLSNNHVQSVIQDKSGNYWFGTSGGGVCNYFGKQFTNYDKSSGLAGNFIYSIFRDSKSRLWIGTSDKGLSVFDSAKFYNYNSKNGFSDVKVKAINEDSNGNIFIGTDGQGLFRYDGKEFKEVEGLTKKYIRAIIKDKDGNMWVATAGAGLYKLTVNESKIKSQNYTTADGLLHNRLTCLHYDKQGRLWYGTENNGIGYLYNGVVQKKYLSRKDGLQSNTIRCLTEDESGYLWVGTAGYGIASFPLYQGDFKIKFYDHSNGLTSSNIYLMCVDKSNNLFVGTETGLDYIYLDKGRKLTEIKHYSKGEGFVGVETCQNSVYNDLDGTIWFGTINGLSKYNPANLVKNENEPITSIYDVKLFYESISTTPYKKFAGDWNAISYLDLPYNQNHLTFDFFAINFSNPDAVKYQWKLEGFDREWSPISKNHSILYSNLSAGEYTFLVKACNEDGVWNKKPVKLKFHIAAPIWLQWWFIALVLIIVFSLVFYVFKWRENRFKSKAAEEQRKLQLEKEVVELEQKALRLQMNPHFIFNALNSIQSQIGNDNEQVARYYLAKFSRLMRQILDNSRNTVITLEEEANTLENYLLIEKFCNGDRFDYKITIDDAIEKDYIKIPPMLLQPFIENAIKHGLKNSDTNKRGLIEVGFKEVNNILECAVIDNGIGRIKSEELNKISKETYHKSTALLVTQERLDLLKQDKNILSLEIFDLYDEQGGASGTKVIVRIPIG
jgi:ligand-binding sensor domain-containing protein